MKYEFLEHTADLKIRAYGKDLEEVFVNSALALKQAIAEDIKVKSEKSKFISVEGKDLSDLLYNFIEEFIYLLDAENFLFSKLEDLNITEEKGEKYPFKLSAEILGDKASNYKFSNDVKAITFNEMRVSEDKKAKKWTAQFVLDV